MKNPIIIQSIATVLNHLWNQAINLLAVADEPHVWQTQTHGQAVWHAYDPATGDHCDGVSEDDIRIWLEHRYYNH